MAWEKRGEKKGSPAGGKNLSARLPSGPNQLARNGAVSGLTRAIYTNMAARGHTDAEDRSFLKSKSLEDRLYVF